MKNRMIEYAILSVSLVLVGCGDDSEKNKKFDWTDPEAIERIRAVSKPSFHGLPALRNERDKYVDQYNNCMRAARNDSARWARAISDDQSSYTVDYWYNCIYKDLASANQYQSWIDQVDAKIKRAEQDR
jgi:hypothetical protein